MLKLIGMMRYVPMEPMMMTVRLMHAVTGRVSLLWTLSYRYDQKQVAAIAKYITLLHLFSSEFILSL